MLSALFDTTVFIDYWRGDASAQRLVSNVVSRHLEAAVTSITAIELWQSPRMGRKEEIEFAAFRRFMHEAQLDVDTAKEVGIMLRSLRRSQRMRLMADAIIATIGKRLNVTVFSRNYRDMVRFHAQVNRY